jgi:hypothetical protein
MAVWYSLWSFGIFFPFWSICTKKIWQPWFHHSMNPSRRFAARHGATLKGGYVELKVAEFQTVERLHTENVDFFDPILTAPRFG